MMYSVKQLDAESIDFQTHNFDNYKLVINDQFVIVFRYITNDN